MPECRSCHAPVVWGTTTSGKLQPLDLEPTADGNCLLNPDGTITVIGPLELLLHEHGQLRMPHHATCPDAATWKRS
jgi:hypothetical protein